MKLQILVATMDQKEGDYSLLKKMELTTNAIICNQCNFNKMETISLGDNEIKWLSFAERGVGLNRNNALMRATGDIIAFADDDMVYVKNYNEIILKAYEELPDADVIVFNVRDAQRSRESITKVGRVHRLNFLRYGTARITCRFSKIKINGIYFNECFGGGTEHCHGEDNLFLKACIDKGLKIYAYPAIIASLTELRPSTWAREYNDRYFYDQGVLYRQVSRRWWKILCLQDAVRHARLYKKTPWYCLKRMLNI